MCDAPPHCDELPRLWGSIIVYIAAWTVLLCNAEYCWLVTIPCDEKIISRKPDQKKRNQPVDVSVVLQFSHVLG